MAVYTGIFSNVTVAAQQDLFELVGPADAVTIIHAIYISQSSEIGDAQEEGLLMGLRRGNTTAGSGGTTVTTNAIETGSSAYGGTLAANRTTKASAGSPVYLHQDAWNVRTSYLWIPTPEMRPILGPSTRICWELMTTPADAVSMTGTIYFEELGG